MASNPLPPPLPTKTKSQLYGAAPPRTSLQSAVNPEAIAQAQIGAVNPLPAPLTQAPSLPAPLLGSGSASTADISAWNGAPAQKNPLPIYTGPGGTNSRIGFTSGISANQSSAMPRAATSPFITRSQTAGKIVNTTVENVQAVYKLTLDSMNRLISADLADAINMFFTENSSSIVYDRLRIGSMDDVKHSELMRDYDFLSFIQKRGAVAHSALTNTTVGKHGLHNKPPSPQPFDVKLNDFFRRNSTGWFDIKSVYDKLNLIAAQQGVSITNNKVYELLNVAIQEFLTRLLTKLLASSHTRYDRHRQTLLYDSINDPYQNIIDADALFIKRRRLLLGKSVEVPAHQNVDRKSIDFPVMGGFYQPSSSVADQTQISDGKSFVGTPSIGTSRELSVLDIAALIDDDLLLRNSSRLTQAYLFLAPQPRKPLKSSLAS